MKKKRLLSLIQEKSSFFIGTGNRPACKINLIKVPKKSLKKDLNQFKKTFNY